MSALRDRIPFGWPDVGLAGFLLLVGFGGTGPAVANQGLPSPGLFGYLLVAAAAVAVVLRRSHPAATFLLVNAVVVTYLGNGFGYGPILLSLVVATYGLASQIPFQRTLRWVGALLGISLLAVAARVIADIDGASAFISTTAWIVLPAAVGVVRKVRRDSAAGVRAEQAKRAVSEERLRMAQEVHDVVGHGLAVIAMQAGVALHVLDRDPAKVREALEAIRSTSRESLDGLRAELDALRGRDTAPRRPSTGLAELPELAKRIRSSGLPVTVHLDRLGRLPAEVDLAAYRIVQESLTNVLRHAGPAATALVRVRQRHGELQIEVTDTGGGSRADRADGAGSGAGPGHGIDGMRHRATTLGGSLEAGPVPDGGFRVRARLPIGSGSGFGSGSLAEPDLPAQTDQPAAPSSWRPA